MTVSLRMSDEHTKIIKAYAKAYGMTLSEFARRAMLEKIEDELDLKIYEKAKKEHEKNPVTYTMDEVAKELGFDA